MGSQKRAKYTQKRKKKLREKAALVPADRVLDRMHEKALWLKEEMAVLRVEYAALSDKTLDEKKVASRIFWLAKTICPEAEAMKDFQIACETMIVAWNVSLRGEVALPAPLNPELFETFLVLVERKKEAFPDDDRFITDYWWEDDDEAGTTLVIWV